MNADGNESKSSMSKQTSVTLKEKGKEVVAEVETTKEVTVQPVEARDKAKDAPNTGPELFPESIPACVAKLTAQPLEAPDKAKDAPSTGPELFPESVPACVAELGSATSFKAPGASNPEIIPMTTVASATKYERKLNANHHVAKIKASRKGGALKMAPPDKDGPELFPETVKNPPFIVAKLGAKKYSGNDEDMVNAKAGPAGTKVKFDMDKPNKNTDVKKRARTTHAAASKTKHGMDVPQGMLFRTQEGDGTPPFTASSVTNVSSNQTGDHQSAGATVSTGNDKYVKQQAMAEQNRRLRERRKMRRQDATSNNEDLNDEGLPSSFPPHVGDSEDTNIAPPTYFSDQYDEMKVEEEEILSQLHKDESQEPGAFAVAGIGAGDPSYAWQSMLEISESQDLTENNQNTNNNRAHLSNEDMISMPDQQVSDGSENLISAIVVDDDAIPEAEAVSEEVLQRNKRKRTLCCLTGLALLIVTIVLAAVLSRDTTTIDDSPAPSQSLAPSTLPSLTPSSSPTTTIRLFLEEVSPLSTAKAFEDETSPQSKALEWLERNHTNLLNTYDEDRIIQRFVLATLFYSTKGEQWIQSNGWLNAAQHECEWFSTHQNSYYRCRDDDEYDEIKLPSNRLKGFLPREIYLLSNLRELDVSDNVLSESFPTELGLLKNIEHINLNGNSFEGSVPTEVGDLNATLTQLDLSSNNIEGKIPSAVGLLTGLESLKFGDNILSGTMISEIGMLSNLKTLSMMGNNLDGTVPTQLFSLERLEVLDLSNNLLSGTLPLTMNQTSTETLMSSLIKLKELRAQSNFITGTLPSVLGLMSKIELLNMNSNRLEGSIPSELGQLVQLETLDLSGNTDISGILPTELGLLKRLESMQISQTHISGSIGTEIAGMENLKSLDLSGNELRSTIPETLMSLVNLESLKVAFNELSGTIPETLGSLENLASFDLSSNDLSGTVPKTLGSLVNLDNFGVVWNDLMTGEVPKELCELRRTNNIEGFLFECEYISCDCCFDRCPNPPRILSSTLSTANCSSGMTMLQVATGTDRDPEGVKWDVVDESTNETLLQGGPLTPDDGYSTILQETCVPNDACLVFTIRGSNGDGSLKYRVTGDRFMVHLNGSEVSNGRFQDFQKDEGFFVGETSSCVAIDRQKACSVTRPMCDSTVLVCDLDNDGGLSGFCVPSEPSVSPSIPSSNPTCDDGLSSIIIELTTDDYPSETSWNLVNVASGDVILEDGNYAGQFKTLFVSQTCISNNACLRFTINDSYGDGLIGGGGFAIYVNNEQAYSGGGNFGESETKVLGSCQEMSFPNVSPSTPSSMPSASPTIQTEIPTESLSPPCQDGMVNFTVEITIENDPERVAWTVVNRNSGSTPSGDGSSNDASILLQGGPYEDNGVMGVDKEGTAAITLPTTFTESACVVSDACLLFKIQDAEAVPSELSFGSVSLDSLLATAILYADGSKVAINAFYGQTTINEVGACSPIQ